jgi:hypothetical protein
MSRSIHTTVKGLARDRLTKSELDEMAERDDTELTDLAKKSGIKRAVREARQKDRSLPSEAQDLSEGDIEEHE